MSGFLPWTAMAEAISSSTTKVLELPNLVKRCVFPLETLPLIVCISSFLSGSIAIILLVVFAGIRQHGIHPTIVFIPLIFVPHFLFTAGMSWFFGTLGVFVRDCRHFIALALSAWMYMTPILYPPERMPEHLQFLLWINPMAGIITDYRRIIIEGRLPDFSSYAWYLMVSLVVCLAGFHIFHRTKRSFADVV
jgi:lipopolysaccharide transport system permease protein